MYAKSICKAPVSRLAISAWWPACLVVLLSLGTFAGTSVADTGAEGTWDGTWVSGDAAGITFDWILKSDGSMTGCWEKPLEPWASGRVTVCVSGTYSYNSKTGVLSIHADGWKYNVQGYDIYIETNINGTVSDNSASGNSSTSYNIYQRGQLVGSDTDKGTWQATRLVIIYVDAGASLGGDGSSWGTAYKYLQDALYKPSSRGYQIWVAEGTYKPDGDEGGNVTPGDRTDTFQLINGVGIYGGFPAGGGNWGERNPDTYITILSGDLNGDGDGFTNNGENSFHVVKGSGTNATARLDGFTITGGNANLGADDEGGGMYNDAGSPTVTNCTFTDNQSTGDGGGMYNYRSKPTVSNCTFTDNQSTGDGGGMHNDDSSPTVTNCMFSGNWAYEDGGGMYNVDYSNPTVKNCIFIANKAYWNGGGMYNYFSSPTVTNCTFSANDREGMSNFGSWPTVTNCTFSENHDGGMANGFSNPTVTNCTFSGNEKGGMSNSNNSSPTVVNCTFSGNHTDLHGGGMSNYNNSGPTVTNCTFSGNSAGYQGGGMSNSLSSPTVTNCTFSGNSAITQGGGMYNDGSSPTVTNCILWSNSDSGGSDESAQIHNVSSTPVVNYCCVQAWTGSLGGTGNIGDDPNFVDPNGPDGMAGTEDDNLRLSADSNCIDAGTNVAVPADTADLDGDGDTSEWTPLDLDGSVRFTNDPGTIDSGYPGLPGIPIVDMGAYEYNEFCGSSTYPYPPGDLSGPDGVRDCYVDFFDFAVFAAHWLEYTGPE